MLEFVKVNVNPKNRKTGDCSTRALANILNISYEQALKEQCEAAIKKCYGITDKETIDYIMKKYGYDTMNDEVRMTVLLTISYCLDTILV